MAKRQRDYKAEYEARNRRAKEAGFESYSQQRKARAAAIKEMERKGVDPRLVALAKSNSKKGLALRDAYALALVRGKQPGGGLGGTVGDVADLMLDADLSPEDFFGLWYWGG